MSDIYITTARAGLRLRAAPSTSGTILALLPFGTRLRADGLQDGWRAVQLSAGGAPYGTGWLSDTHLQPDAPAPIEVVSASRLLGIHELHNHVRAREALELGARAVMVFEDALGAAQLAESYPDAIVMHRKYFTQPISPAELIAQHGINPISGTSSSRAFYRGVNESDVPGFGSEPEDIYRRARFDLECAAILKARAPNATWIAGGWAHGNPNFLRQDVCDAMRQAYSGAYNAGAIWFDIHNYSKPEPGSPKNYRFYEPKWFERRADFLFWNCGFNPAVRHIVSTEAGIEAGAGGFAWAGFSPDEFREWCSYYLNAMRQPITVNGQVFQSPYAASTIFQWGDTNGGSGGWQGYALDNYIPVLREKYQARGMEIAPTLNIPDDHDYAPPAKVLTSAINNR